jgi:hypothetical protein
MKNGNTRIESLTFVGVGLVVTTTDRLVIGGALAKHDTLTDTEKIGLSAHLADLVKTPLIFATGLTLLAATLLRCGTGHLSTGDRTVFATGAGVATIFVLETIASFVLFSVVLAGICSTLSSGIAGHTGGFGKTGIGVGLAVATTDRSVVFGAGDVFGGGSLTTFGRLRAFAFFVTGNAVVIGVTSVGIGFSITTTDGSVDSIADLRDSGFESDTSVRHTGLQRTDHLTVTTATGVATIGGFESLTFVIVGVVVFADFAHTATANRLAVLDHHSHRSKSQPQNSNPYQTLHCCLLPLKNQHFEEKVCRKCAASGKKGIWDDNSPRQWRFSEYQHMRSEIERWKRVRFLKERREKIRGSKANPG